MYTRLILTLSFFRLRPVVLACALFLTLHPSLHTSALAQGPGATASPALMLANVYKPTTALQDYWVSEKYDGVRAYWDGSGLRTRGGETIAAPAWFTVGWPSTPLDGELWAGRGQFSRAVSTIRQQKPDDQAWRGLRFMVFDLPAHGGVFTERIAALHGTVSQIDALWVQAVPQKRIESHAALQRLLMATVRQGGEGLMLHRGSSLYKGVRSDDLLKVKTHDDAEAQVVAHIAGKGKHAGRVGALLVEMPAAHGMAPQRFKIGTGLTDADRTQPPPVGSRITYRFRGLTDSGLPRFASFLRVREDL